MERIGVEIERELARSGSRDALPLAAITAVWPAAVGEAVACRAWPSRIGRDGTLHVAAVSSTWAYELSLLADEIMEQLRHRLDAEAPSKLRFAVGPVPDPPTTVEQSPEVENGGAAVPPEVSSEASDAASAIEDPELRDLVARAARASLLKARSGRSFW